MYWPGWFPAHFHFLLRCLVSVWFVCFFEKLGQFLWLGGMIFIMRLGNCFGFSGNCISLFLFLCYLPDLFGFRLLYVYPFLGMLLVFAWWVRLLGACWVCFMVFVCTWCFIVFEVYCFPFFFSAFVLNLPLLRILGPLLGQIHHWRSDFGFGFTMTSLYGWLVYSVFLIHFVCLVIMCSFGFLEAGLFFSNWDACFF